MADNLGGLRRVEPVTPGVNPDMGNKISCASVVRRPPVKTPSASGNTVPYLSILVRLVAVCLLSATVPGLLTCVRVVLGGQRLERFHVVRCVYRELQDPVLRLVAVEAIPTPARAESRDVTISIGYFYLAAHGSGATPPLGRVINPGQTITCLSVFGRWRWVPGELGFYAVAGALAGVLLVALLLVAAIVGGRLALGADSGLPMLAGNISWSRDAPTVAAVAMAASCLVLFSLSLLLHAASLRTEGVVVLCELMMVAASAGVVLYWPG